MNSIELQPIERQTEETNKMTNGFNMKWLTKQADENIVFVTFGAILLAGAFTMLIVLFCSSSTTSTATTTITGTRVDGKSLCLPTREIPGIKVAQLLAEEEATALARIGGFVELFNDSLNETTYLPLDLHTIARDTNYDGLQYVKFLGDCVELELWYVLIQSPQRIYNFTGLDMNIRNGAKRSNKIAKKICHFRSPFKFNQLTNFRYSCKETRNHLCVASAPGQNYTLTKANLVLTLFEFELDGGNVTKLLQNEFQKSRLSRSCDKWSDWSDTIQRPVIQTTGHKN